MDVATMEMPNPLAATQQESPAVQLARAQVQSLKSKSVKSASIASGPGPERSAESIASETMANFENYTKNVAPAAPPVAPPPTTNGGFEALKNLPPDSQEEAEAKYPEPPAQSQHEQEEDHYALADEHALVSEEEETQDPPSETPRAPPVEPSPGLDWKVRNLRESMARVMPLVGAEQPLATPSAARRVNPTPAKAKSSSQVLVDAMERPGRSFECTSKCIWDATALALKYLLFRAQTNAYDVVGFETKVNEDALRERVLKRFQLCVARIDLTSDLQAVDAIAKQALAGIVVPKQVTTLLHAKVALCSKEIAQANDVLRTSVEPVVARLLGRQVEAAKAILGRFKLTLDKAAEFVERRETPQPRELGLGPNIDWQVLDAVVRPKASDLTLDGHGPVVLCQYAAALGKSCAGLKPRGIAEQMMLKVVFDAFADAFVDASKRAEDAKVKYEIEFKNVLSELSNAIHQKHLANQSLQSNVSQRVRHVCPQAAVYVTALDDGLNLREAQAWQLMQVPKLELGQIFPF